MPPPEPPEPKDTATHSLRHFSGARNEKCSITIHICEASLEWPIDNLCILMIKSFEMANHHLSY